MFGQTPPAVGKIADWLQHLKAADPSSRAGELMHKSLLEDGNVCNEYRDRTRQFIESQPPPSNHRAPRTRIMCC